MNCVPIYAYSPRELKHERGAGAVSGAAGGAILVTPSDGLVLDPFLGSGTTALACLAEGMRCLGIEREEEYVAIAQQRLLDATRQGDLFSREEAAQSTTSTLSEPQCHLFPQLS